MFLILLSTSCSSSSVFASRRHTIFNGNDAAWRNIGGTPYSCVQAGYFRDGNGKHLIRLTSNFRLSCCWKPAAYFCLVSAELFDRRIEISSIVRRVQCSHISTIFFSGHQSCRRKYICIYIICINGQIYRTSHFRTKRCGTENLGRRNTSEALDLIESLIKCTSAPITEPFYDSRFGKLSEIVPD